MSDRKHQPAGAVVLGVKHPLADDTALREAIREARASHRPLHLIHAVGLGLVPWTEEYLEMRNKAFSACRDRAREQAPDLDISYTVHVDDPAAMLVTASETAHVIVLGSSGFTRTADVVRGATTRKVVAHSHCPVLVTPHHDRWNESGSVVVGVDAAPHSVPAMEWAFSEASEQRAPLTAVHTWWWEGAPAAPLAGSTWDGDIAQVAESERLLLAEMLAGLQEKYPDVHVEKALTRGQAALVLEELSRTARLVVVGSRGRGGFTGLLLGSVSDRTVHHAHCPVVVVPSHPQSRPQG